MDTIYPHLTRLMDALTKGLSLEIPVMAYASLDQVTLQGSPNVFLIPEATQPQQVIANVRTISSVRFRQEWTILTVLRDAGDQRVTTPLITQMGEWQARILRLLMTDVLQVGGPIQILDLPKNETIEGGAIVGRILLGTQFVFSVE
jgi:hypothetical protein